MGRLANCRPSAGAAEIMADSTHPETRGSAAALDVTRPVLQSRELRKLRKKVAGLVPPVLRLIAAKPGME